MKLLSQAYSKTLQIWSGEGGIMFYLGKIHACKAPDCLIWNEFPDEFTW